MFSTDGPCMVLAFLTLILPNLHFEHWLPKKNASKSIYTFIGIGFLVLILVSHTIYFYMYSQAYVMVLLANYQLGVTCTHTNVELSTVLNSAVCFSSSGMTMAKVATITGKEGAVMFNFIVLSCTVF